MTLSRYERCLCPFLRQRSKIPRRQLRCHGDKRNWKEEMNWIMCILCTPRPMYRSIYVGRYVSRYIDRYVNHWLSVEYRSTVGGISVDCRVLYYNQASNILDCSQSPIFPWDRRCRSLSSTGRHFGFSIRGKLEKRSRKTVCYSEQIMSADKIIAYFRARWTVLFLYITIISRVTGDQISSPDAENKRGEQHTSAGRGRLSRPNLEGFHGK